jgi:hypothetical protein
MRDLFTTKAMKEEKVVWAALFVLFVSFVVKLLSLRS